MKSFRRYSPIKVLGHSVVIVIDPFENFVHHSDIKYSTSSFNKPNNTFNLREITTTIIIRIISGDNVIKYSCKIVVTCTIHTYLCHLYYGPINVTLCCN